MFSLPRSQTLVRASVYRSSITPSTALRTVCTRKFLQTNTSRSLFNLSSTKTKTPIASTSFSQPLRFYASTSSSPSSSPTADQLIETLTDQYATAKDEFEIASEETDKKSIYAEADREAAVSEWKKLKDMYDLALKGEFGDEVNRRVGGRMRELERAVEVLVERGNTED